MLPLPRCLARDVWATGNRFKVCTVCTRRTQTCHKGDSVHITQHWGAVVLSLLKWKSNKYYIILVCVCSLRYPACNERTPHCHLWPARLYNIYIFFTLSHKRHEFCKKKFIGHKMCVWIFSTAFVWNIFHFKKNWARYCHILIKLDYFFRKIIKYKV